MSKTVKVLIYSSWALLLLALLNYLVGFYAYVYFPLNSGLIAHQFTWFEKAKEFNLTRPKSALQEKYDTMLKIQSIQRATHNVTVSLGGKRPSTSTAQTNDSGVTKSMSAENTAAGITSAAIVNPHDFRYIHNPDTTCSGGETEVVVCSPSSLRDFSVRRAVREKRRPVTGNVAYHTKLLFFLGVPKTPDPSLQKQIDDEAAKYKDIVQENFVDSYRNLTLKSVAMLKWVTTYCKTAKFVIKSDTDVKITLENLILAMHRQYEDQHTFIIGRISVKGGPIRDSHSKWYVSKDMYTDSRYPAFAFGPTYGYTLPAARLLYNTSLRQPFFYLEDVYLTGLCARRAGVIHVSDPLFVYKH